MNPNQDGKVYEEVELRLRSSLSAHNCTGYEVMFRCSKTPKAYCNVARWEGPLGRFTMLKETLGSKYGVQDGDEVRATMFGNVLTVFINGAQVVRLQRRQVHERKPRDRVLSRRSHRRDRRIRVFKFHGNRQIERRRFSNSK